MASAVLSRRLRWLAPVVAGGLVAAGVVVPRLADAAETVEDLPPRSAAELLAAVSTAEVDGLSGTAVMTSDLGLPDLPRAEGGGALSLPGLLAGSTEVRVWKSGDEQLRLAVDAPFAEYDVVRDERDLWTYDSSSNEVTHVVLPEPDADEADDPPSTLPEGAATPEQAAEAALALVTETTEVSVGDAAEVAGRAAYELVLDPRDPGTLVDSVRIAVDAATSLPLRVQVRAVGQREPAVEVGYTEIDVEAPAASVFDFAPPSGAVVQERTLPHTDGSVPDTSTSGGVAQQPSATLATAAGPRVLGEGWTSVVVLSGVTLPEETAGLVDGMARRVPGGRVVESALASVLLLDDGRVLAGAVPAKRLLELAEQ